MTELLKGTFFINGREKDYKWSFYMKLYRNWQKKYIHDLKVKLTSIRRIHIFF